MHTSCDFAYLWFKSLQLDCSPSHSAIKKVRYNLIMKCLIIVGPPAVGKMTVGRAIVEKTGYKLLHNHMTIDLLLNFFEHGSPQFWKLDKLFRFSIMEEVAKSKVPGFIFTFLWGFNSKEDEEYIQEIEKSSSREGQKPYFLNWNVLSTNARSVTKLRCGLSINRPRET